MSKHDPFSERATHVKRTLARVLHPNTPSSMVNGDKIASEMAVNLVAALGLDDLSKETATELLAHVGLNHDDIRDAFHRALRGLVRDAVWYLDERAEESQHARPSARAVAPGPAGDQASRPQWLRGGEA